MNAAECQWSLAEGCFDTPGQEVCLLCMQALFEDPDLESLQEHADLGLQWYALTRKHASYKGAPALELPLKLVALVDSA